MRQSTRTIPYIVGLVAVMLAVCLVAIAILSTISAYPQIHQRSLDTRLWRAAMRNDASEVEDLIHQGANINGKDEDGNPLLDAVLSLHYVATARVLLHNKVDVHAVNSRVGISHALMSACRIGDEDIVAELIEQGVDVNAQTREGHTALMSAANSKQPKIVSYLLAHGADRSLRDVYGYTALTRAQKILDQTPYPNRKAEYAAIIKLLQ